MGLQYKKDVLAELKAKGYPTTRLRKEKLLSESTVQMLRDGKSVSWASLEVICGLLECQPGELLEYTDQ